MSSKPVVFNKHSMADGEKQAAREIDWTQAGRLMEASESARAAGFATGTTNWAAHVCRTMLAAAPTTEPSKAEQRPQNCGSGFCSCIECPFEPSKAEQADAPSYAPLTGRTHDLKIDGPVFSEVVAGRKLFEIRKNDRGFQCGDLLRLRETRLTGAEMAAGQPLIYTGKEKTVRVIGIIHGPKYGLADGFCVMSIATQPPASNAREALQAIERIESVTNKTGYQAGVLRQATQQLRAALATKPQAGDVAQDKKGGV